MKPGRGYYDMLIQTCARHPARVAVRQLTEGRCTTYTYSELYGVCEYVSQNLRLLRCGSGVIGILTDRNPLVPAVIAAVHKNSPTFMFLDPLKDNSHTMKSVNFQVIISLHYIDQSFNVVDWKPNREIIIFDIVLKFYKTGNSSEFNGSHLTERSFIVTTSGSTGEPKQVRVPVQCIQPNIEDLQKMFNMTSSDVVYFSTPLTFDPSMVELLLACTSGASLLVAPATPDIPLPQQSENTITVWQTTPSKFFQLSSIDIASKILSADSKLKILALGGEPLNHIKQLKELKAKENKTRIFCLYGVTELSCWACAVELQLDKMADDKDIPLGDCLSETELEVSLHNKESPLGNILLGSCSRKCSILNRPASHLERRGMSWIDTGDVGEVRNGTVYYRGRTDEVIKRFGNKVNLHRIEKMTMLCSRVTSCSCLWLPNPHVLILYYTSELLFCEELGLFLKNKLDENHIPDKIVRIESMPLNRHGKICKDDLTDKYAAESPEGSLEQYKSVIMKELQLSLKHRFTYDEIKNKDYFTIGGTSFRAIALCNKLAAAYPQQHYSLLSSLLTHNFTIEHILNTLQQEFTSKEKHKSLRLRKRKERKILSSSRIENAASKIPTGIVGCRITKLWSFDTGKCVDSTPTVFKTAKNTFVAVGSHSGKLVVLNATDGAVTGLIDMKSRMEAPVFCYQHTVIGVMGVVGTYDGTIVCFSLSDCTITWKINIKSMIKSKATSANGILFVASYDGNVRCIDFVTGDIQYVIRVGVHGISADLVSAMDKWLIVATLAGKCIGVSVKTNTVVWSHEAGSPIFASPVLYNNDQMVIFAEVRGVVHCRFVKTGIPVWKYEGTNGNIFSSFSIKCIGFSEWDVLFGCHDCNLYCLNVQESKVRLKWTTKTTAPIYSTPCYFSDSFILASSINGKLHLIESECGKVVLEYDLPGETFSSPIVLENQIFIGCRDDLVYSLKCTVEK